MVQYITEMSDLIAQIEGMIARIPPDAPVVLPRRWIAELLLAARQPTAKRETQDRLLTAAQVASEVFGGAVEAVWVRRNVVIGRYRPAHKRVFWRERELREAITKGLRVT